LKLSPDTYGREPLKFLNENDLLPPNILPRYELLVNQICDYVDPLFKNVEFLLLHGDCHSGNILWNNDNPYFIDFDDMLYAPPVQDFWMLTGSGDSYGQEMRKQ